MRRALLLGFLVAPVPWAVWCALILRRSHPDPITMSLGGLAMSLPVLWWIGRVSRRPVYLSAWAATAGAFFWTSVREAVFGDGGWSGMLGILLFPVSGYHVLERDAGRLYPVGMLVFGVLAGFASILRRAVPPSEEAGGGREPEEDEPTPPPLPPRPHFVPRPPPKPKGPAQTPRQKPPEAPRPKRVPGA